MAGGRTQLPTIAGIQRVVARECGVALAIMCEPRPFGCRSGINRRDKSHARQLAMTLAFRLTDHSQSRIGHFFGHRDRTTVLRAVKVVDARCRDNSELRKSMRRMTLELIRKDAP